MATKVKIQIKNRWTGTVLFEYEKTDNTIRDTVIEAIKAKADLSNADLSEANLSWANLSKANLSWANLSKADLSKANLSWANLSKADLSEANLSWANLSWANLSEADLSEANLSVIKNDFWDVLLHAIPEVQFLKSALIEGRVDGSTYNGDCACLVGTLEKCDRFKKVWNGNLRNSYRPIERFFLGIKKGDKPATNAASKMALKWVEEFESYLIPVKA